MKMKHALLALATLLTLPCAAMAQSYMTNTVIGCRNIEDTKNWLNILKQGDKIALDKLEENRINQGECIKLIKSKTVYPMKIERFNGDQILCARPAGEFECYWTAQAFTSDRS